MLDEQLVEHLQHEQACFLEEAEKHLAAWAWLRGVLPARVERTVLALMVARGTIEAEPDEDGFVHGDYRFPAIDGLVRAAWSCPAPTPRVLMRGARPMRRPRGVRRTRRTTRTHRPPDRPPREPELVGQAAGGVR